MLKHISDIKASAKKNLLSHILIALVLAAVIWYIYSNFGKIRSFEFDFDWRLVIAAYFASLGALVLSFFTWEMLTAAFGLKAPRFRAANAYFRSQLGKYVPGKVGTILVRLDAYRGYPRKSVALSMGVEYISCFISACVIVIVAMLFADLQLPSFVRWVAAGMLVVLLASLWPPFFKSAANLVCKLFKRQPIEFVPSFGKILLFVSMYVGVGFFHGLCLFLVLNSLSYLAFDYFLLVAGTFWAAGIIGIAAFFAPAGIGVREGVLMLVLPKFVPEATVIVGVILVRLVMTASELTLAGLFSLLDGRLWHYRRD